MTIGGRQLGIGAALWLAFGSAHGIEDKYEYSQRIKAAQAVAPLGSSLFGDETNYYTGTTTFSVTDIDLPGNNSLPVRVTRTFSTVQAEGPTAPALMGEWELDMPYMSGVFSQSAGWQLGYPDPIPRCSGPQDLSQVQPTSVAFATGGGMAGAVDYWRGNSLNVPGQGEQQVLYRQPGNPAPTDGQSYPWMTSGNWQIRCLPSIANPGPGVYGGEGFVALAPDGTQYFFDWMVVRPFSTYARKNTCTGSNPECRQKTLPRSEIRLYATLVQDRFGNWVQYEYADEKIGRIYSSDGRQITFDYYDTTGKIKTATVVESNPLNSPQSRTWQYSYTTSNRLNRVDLPDASFWTINTTVLVITYLPQHEATEKAIACTTPGTRNGGDTVKTIDFKHPNGATGTFQLKPTYRYRSVPLAKACKKLNEAGEPLEPGAQRFMDNYALVGKTITGPNMSATTWSMAYGEHDGITVVTHPDQSKVRYTFGRSFYVDDGKLLQQETISLSGVVLRDERLDYVTSPGWDANGDEIAPSGTPYAYLIGATGMEHEDAFAGTRRTPQKQRVITQDNTTFTWQVPSVANFDSRARPTRVQRSSASWSKTEVTAYHDNTNLWVLGQVDSVTDVATGLVERQTQYDSLARPEAEWAFGKLMQLLTYYGPLHPLHPNLLKTIANEAGETTTLLDWKRGIPQTIQYPDFTTQAADVDDYGWIRWIRDERFHETKFDYDAIGRISGITYPTGGAVAWANPVIGYGKLAAAELGIVAGSWRREETIGTYRDRTYYDARLRPVLREQKDLLSGKTIYQRRRFDHENRETFTSYPSDTSGATAGVTSTFDAIGRLKERKTTDNIVLETIAHYIDDPLLAGSKHRVTDADGKSTTSTFQAFDEPNYSTPTRIDGQEGQTTLIERDVFGKILTLTQQGTYNSALLTHSRQYWYDEHQRPCRRKDPESAATLWGYDLAGRIEWELKGQPDAPIGSECLLVAPAGASMFGYDPRGRLEFTNHPGVADDVTRDYDDAGNLTLAQKTNSTWTYDYNERNLPNWEQAQIDGRTFRFDKTYDPLAHVASLMTPDRTIDYVPDAWGRPTSLGTYATGIQYHANSLPKSYTLGNGVAYTQTLDNRLRPASQETRLGSSVLQRFAYTYYAAGDLKFFDDQTDGADDRTLEYDDLHRLEAVRMPFIQEFSTSQSVVVPNGVEAVKIKLSGGGGGGGRHSTGGAGGGGGAYCEMIAVPVAPSDWGRTIVFTTGSAGTGARVGVGGTPGAASALAFAFAAQTLDLRAGGGGAAPGATPGVGGTASGCDINTAGYAGKPKSGYVGGKGGNSPNGGLGGAGGVEEEETIPGNGGNGGYPGGGGGGGSKANLEFPTLFGNGGNGGGGRVRFEWQIVIAGYQYDPLNNLRAKTGPTALTYGYIDGTNRLTSVSGSQSRSYTYNAKGEATGDGSRTFTPNADGQIEVIGGIATYGYDGNGRRIKTTVGTTTEYTLYDLSGTLIHALKVPATGSATSIDYLSLGGQVIGEISKTGTTTTPTYLHPDLLGSPRKASNAAGEVMWQEHYDPYGAKQSGVTSTRIGYTGHVNDAESGLTYMQARFYDPAVGRFLSTDPVHFVDQNPFTFNRYAYANNNPYRYVDPNGEAAALLYPVLAMGEGAGAAAVITAATTAAVAASDVPIVVRIAIAADQMIAGVMNATSDASSAPADTPETASDKIRAGTKPATGVSGKKGELEGSGGKAGAHGAVDGVDGSNDRTTDTGARVKDLNGGTIETHASSKSTDYAKGTQTVKVRDASGKVVTTVRYPENQ